MQVFSGIYLNFAGLAAVVEKTGFLQKLLTCFRGGFEGMVCDFGILRAATVASMTALPRSSDAVLAAYERGGVYGIAVAEATKQQRVAVARTTSELVVTSGRLRAAPAKRLTTLQKPTEAPQ